VRHNIESIVGVCLCVVFAIGWTRAQPAQPIDEVLKAVRADLQDSRADILKKNVTLTPATETDTAQPLTFTKTIFVTLTPVVETDTAVPLVVTKPIFVSLTPVTETDTAVQLLVGAQSKTITPVTETDTAEPLNFTKTIFVSLTPVVETDTAQGLQLQKSVTLVPATETDSTVPLLKVKSTFLVPATETDTAFPLVLKASIRVALGAAIEQDEAVPLNITVGGVAPVDFVPDVRKRYYIARQGHRVRRFSR